MSTRAAHIKMVGYKNVGKLKANPHILPVFKRGSMRDLVRRLFEKSRQAEAKRLRAEAKLGHVKLPKKFEYLRVAFERDMQQGIGLWESVTDFDKPFYVTKEGKRDPVLACGDRLYVVVKAPVGDAPAGDAPVGDVRSGGM